MKYKMVGNAPQYFPDLYGVVNPGDIVETDKVLVNPNLERIKDTPASPAKGD